MERAKDRTVIVKTAPNLIKFVEIIYEATELGYNLIFSGHEKDEWVGVFKLGSV